MLLAMNDACPCQSGRPEPACCGPYLRGESPAPTAEALMRSRYCAYVRGAVDYIVTTHDPATRAEVDRAAAEKWSKGATWQGLEILATTGGSEADQEGMVEFVARYTMRGGAATAHHERSRFRREAGAWVYVDGETGPFAREQAKRTETAGRNDPCPCGSGKKFKRCHGA
jgi:SEC-C motif-containing protein